MAKIKYLAVWRIEVTSQIQVLFSLVIPLDKISKIHLVVCLTRGLTL